MISTKTEPDMLLQSNAERGFDLVSAACLRVEGHEIERLHRNQSVNAIEQPSSAKRKAPSVEDISFQIARESDTVYKRQKIELTDANISTEKLESSNLIDQESNLSSRPSSRAHPVPQVSENGLQPTASRSLSHPPEIIHSKLKPPFHPSSEAYPMPFSPSRSTTILNPLQAPLSGHTYPLPPPSCFNQIGPHPYPSWGYPSPFCGPDAMLPSTLLPPPPISVHPLPQPQHPHPSTQHRSKAGPYPSRVIEQQAERVMEVIKDEVMFVWQMMKAKEKKDNKSQRDETGVQSKELVKRISQGIQTDTTHNLKEVEEKVKSAFNSERSRWSTEVLLLKEENARLRGVVDKLERTIIKLESKLETPPSKLSSLQNQEFADKIRNLEEINGRLRGVISHLDPDGSITVTEDGYGMYSAV